LDILGPGRYKLWKENNLSMSDLVNNAGRTLTLEELAGVEGVEVGDVVSEEVKRKFITRTIEETDRDFLEKLYRNWDDTSKDWELSFALGGDIIAAYGGTIAKPKLLGYVKIGLNAYDDTKLMLGKMDISKKVKNKVPISLSLFRETIKAIKKFKGLKTLHSEFATEEGLRMGEAIARKFNLKIVAKKGGYQPTKFNQK